MKILIALFFSLILLLQNISFPQQSGKMIPLVYMVMISSPEEEKQADILIKSVRMFGGEYSKSPVVIVISDSTKTRAASLTDKAEKIIVLKMNENFRQFPFADKIYACAQVEQMYAEKAEWLVWLNPDVLITAPPVEIAKDKNAWAALRPVHIQNIGIEAESPITDFWSRIYKLSGVDTSKIWNVESFVDNKEIRGYFNSGCMAFNPSKGILTAWKNDFEGLMSDSSNFSFYTASQPFAVFCHQALLSAVIMAKAEKQNINMLSSSYGYPIQLQQQEGFINKKTSLSDLVIVITGGYENLKYLQIGERYQDWIKSNIP